MKCIYWQKSGSFGRPSPWMIFESKGKNITPGLYVQRVCLEVGGIAYGREIALVTKANDGSLHYHGLAPKRVPKYVEKKIHAYFAQKEKAGT